MTDEDRPVRCVVLPGRRPLADEFAEATGLTVLEASLLTETHLMRGAE